MPKTDVLPLRLHVFSTDQVTKHLKDVDVLSSLMAMVRALTDNSNLFLEPYVRQLPYGYYGAQKGVLNHGGHSFFACARVAAPTDAGGADVHCGQAAVPEPGDR